MHRIRFAIGASVGGLYAVGLFLPGFSFLRRPFYKILFALMMLLLAYGAGKHLLRQSLFFFLLTCAFGGAVMAVGMFGGQGLLLGNGIFYSAMDRKVVYLAAAICYMLASTVFRRVGKYSHVSGELQNLKICLMGNHVEISALLDTGNTLTDPISGQGVTVVEAEAVASLFSLWQRKWMSRLDDPAYILPKLGEGAWRGRFRLLPYRTVGVSNGLLLAVRSDWMEVNGKRQEGALIALSPTPLSDGGGYRAMIGREGVL